jgi:MFS superfamily sulfate permease-like transporter
VPCIVYALFGSSRQLAVGPVAVTSMLLGTGLGNMFDFVNVDPNNPSDPAAQEQYNHAAVQVGAVLVQYCLLRLPLPCLQWPRQPSTSPPKCIGPAQGCPACMHCCMSPRISSPWTGVQGPKLAPSLPHSHLSLPPVLQVAFIAGLMYTTVGLLRLGWLTNFLSHTTISGFMSGACIVIALSQVGLGSCRKVKSCWLSKGGACMHAAWQGTQVRVYCLAGLWAVNGCLSHGISDCFASMQVNTHGFSPARVTDKQI